MHELSIITSIVDNVKSEVERHKVNKVLAVEIEIGEFAFLNGEQPTYLYGVLLKDTKLDGSELIIKEIKGKVKCS